MFQNTVLTSNLTVLFFFLSRYPLVLDWYAKSICMTSACLYLTACKCKWSRKKVNLADQWPYTVDLQKQLDTAFVQNVTAFSSFHFSTSCEDERHRKGKVWVTLSKRRKCKAAEHARTHAQSVALIRMYRMTTGQSECSVSPEDRNLRNPVLEVTWFILNTPFRVSFGDRVRSWQEESEWVSEWVV